MPILHQLEQTSTYCTYLLQKNENELFENYKSLTIHERINAQIQILKLKCKVKTLACILIIQFFFKFVLFDQNE